MIDRFGKVTTEPEMILGESWAQLRVVGWTLAGRVLGSSGSVGLYAPARVAKTVNGAREELLLMRSVTDADLELCLRAAIRRPAPVVETVAEPADSGDVLGTVGQLEQAAPGAAEQGPAAKRPDDVSAAANTAPAPPSVPLHEGIPVAIVDDDAFDAWQRSDVAAVSKLPRFEVEARKTLVKAVVARGRTRVVALRSDWPQGFATLRRDMPTFGEVIDHLEQCCHVSEVAAAPLRIGPVLLVGGPGSGKSRFAMALADVIGSTSFIYNLDTSSTTSVLDGIDKHWANSEPGQLFRLIALGDVANPVVLLDEIDKAPTGAKYRPTAALHSALEPATARRFMDKSCDLVFDASYVVYVATANALSPLEPSLLSRFRLFHIQPPSIREALAVARSVARAQLAEMGLAQSFEPITHGPVLQEIALIRGGARAQAAAVRRAVARALAEGRRSISPLHLAETATTGAKSWTQ